MIGSSEGKMYENEFDMLLGNHKMDRNEAQIEKKPVISPQSGGEDTSGKGNSIFIVRHGATALNGEDHNSVDKIRGWSDVPLSDKGREEAKATAEGLKDKGITALVASNLGRAKETADIIGKAIGVTPEYTHDLRPWDLGKFTGTSTKEAIPKLREYSTTKQDEKVPEGESFNEFKGRAFKGVSQAIADHPNDKLAIVTHHRVERLLHAWDQNGQKEDGSIHDPTFLQKGETPGSYTTLNISDKVHDVPEKIFMESAKWKLSNALQDYYASQEGRDILNQEYGKESFKGSEPSVNVENRLQNDLSMMDPRNLYTPEHRTDEEKAAFRKEAVKTASPEWKAMNERSWREGLDPAHMNDPMAIAAGIKNIEGAAKRAAKRPKVPTS